MKLKVIACTDLLYTWPRHQSYLTILDLIEGDWKCKRLGLDLAAENKSCWDGFGQFLGRNLFNTFEIYAWTLMKQLIECRHAFLLSDTTLIDELS